MITSEELRYVGAWARKTPFPGKNYAINAINNLSKALEKYIEVYMNTKYSLTLSNGEIIEYKILSRNLAHLLGIEFKNLISEPMQQTVENILDVKSFEERKSFDILRMIIERADDVIKNDSDPNNKRMLNYQRIMVKSLIFLGIPDFDGFDFGCINFDKSLYSGYNQDFVPQKSSKYLFIPSGEALVPYFMMGLKYDYKEKLYVPETTLCVDNLGMYINNQELVLPTDLIINYLGYINKLEIPNERKIQLLNFYKNIIYNYRTNTNINVCGDYERMLREKQRSLYLK